MVSERPNSLLSVADVASRLGVTASRVRALAESGQLAGEKVGRHWVFSPADVDRWRNRVRAGGRPLAPSAALGLLYELSGERASWLERVARWKVLHSQAASDLALLVPRAARRAERVERRAHPSDLPRLAAEPGVVRGGVSAVRDVGIDLVAPGAVELYLDKKAAERLIRRYSLAPSSEPNVVLHVLDRSEPLDGRDAMPLGVVVVDLIESGDPRAASAARSAWTAHRKG